MAGGPWKSLLMRLRGRVGGPRAPELSDAQLLEDFCLRRDEGAFTALLERHGPLVLDVCHRILGDCHDAEDAFQATFLVLVRKAGSIRSEATVASWLYGVAYRTSLKARASAARRHARDRRVALMSPEAETPEGFGAELGQLIHEEVNRLPAKYRAAVVLCYLQGKSHRDAAGLLACPEGTLGVRLSRARDLLRNRLSRRGVALATIPLAGLLERQGLASAALPPALAGQTLRAALAFSAPWAVEGAISSSALSLTEGVLRSMFLTKLKLTLLALLAACLLAAGSGLLAGHLLQADDDTPAPATPQRAAEGEATPQPAAKKEADPLPPQAVARLGSLRFRQPAAISSLFLSPDGKRVVTGGTDGVARLWNGATGVQERGLQVPGGTPWVHSVSFSRDGKTFAAGVYFSGEIVLWETATGKEIQKVELEGGGSVVALAPDGKVFATGDAGGGLRLWDRGTGKMLHDLKGHTNLVGFVLFTPDSKTMITGSMDKTARLWEVGTGKERLTISLEHVPGDRGGGTRGAVTSDGKILALAGGRPCMGGRKLSAEAGDNKIRLYDTAEGKERRVLAGHADEIADLTFSPDDRLLASASFDGTIRLWETASGKEVRKWAAHPGGTVSVVFATDSKTLTSGGNDNAIRRWDAATGKEIDPWEAHAGAVCCVAFSADSRQVVTGDEQGILRVWDAATGRLSHRHRAHTDPIGRVSFLDNDQALLSGGQADRIVRVTALASGDERSRSLGEKTEALLAVDSVGKLAVFVSEKLNSVRLVEARSGKELRRITGADTEQFRALSPDGKLLVTIQPDGDMIQVRLRDADSGKERQQFKVAVRELSAIVFSPDSSRLAAINDRNIRVWDTATGKEVCNVESSQAVPTTIALAAWNDRLAVGGDDGTVIVIDLGTRKELHTLRGHQGQVDCLSFAPDGTTLASGSADTTLLLWDLRRKGR